MLVKHYSQEFSMVYKANFLSINDYIFNRYFSASAFSEYCEMCFYDNENLFFFNQSTIN